MLKVKPAHTAHPPTDEQSAILSAACGTDDNLILNALAGCIAAGTLISIRRGNDLTIRKRPIEQLLHLRKPQVPTFVQCDVNGHIQYLQMNGCHYSGVKDTLRMETTFGEVIATPDHEIKTENGWKELGSINVGTWVYTRERIQLGRQGGRITIHSVRHHPFAYQHNIGEYGNYKRISRARLVVEASMNNLSLEEMILIVRHDPYRSAQLKYLVPGLEVHHKNEDPSDDRLENLEVLTHDDHKRRHESHKHNARLGLSKIIAVTQAGNHHTYDIMMPAPHHNFLANGHVVHNCGKSTTLEMIERAVKTKPCLYLVFNTKNAKEAEKRMQSTTTVRTFNSLGHRIWAVSQGRSMTVEPKKCPEILRSLCKERKGSDREAAWSVFWDVIAAVNMAKAVGYIPDGAYGNVKRICSKEEFYATLDEKPDELVEELIDEVLLRSIRSAYDGLIDYNDQIYMPAVFGGTFPQFPLTLVDEAQDLSPVNHALLHRLVNTGRRAIAVGDPNQSIYQFRGAKQDGMGALVDHYSMKALDLSISFRCPRRIVENARWRVPKFNWIKEGGYVETCTELQAGDIPVECTFLCRNNAPLFRLAMQLLSRGRSIQIAGSEIGPRLVGIMRKLGSEDLNQAQVLGAIAEWQAAREEKGSVSAKDLADCMRVFASHGSTLSLAIAYAEHLFKQTGSIKLSTGHKAKGLEWDTVFVLDQWLMRGDEQDLNLRYVCDTRSMNKLFYINSEAIKW